MIKKLNTLSDTIFELPGTKWKLISVEDLKQFLKKENEFIKKIIIDCNGLDKYFPKDDKRRGEVLAILAEINSNLTKHIKDKLGKELI